MKNIKYKILIACGLFAMSMQSCKKDFANPNAANSGDVLNTREGMFRYSLSLIQFYSTSNLGSLVVATGATTREIKGKSTLLNVIDIEAGGSALPTDNGTVNGLFNNSMRTMAAAEDIINNAPTVLASDPATLSGVLSNARLFKAMAIGALATAYENLPQNVDRSGKAVFSPRIAALQSAVVLLDQAAANLAATPPSAEFNTRILGGTNFDLINTVNAFRARLNLMAGNYAAAKTAADLVNLSSKSVFTYSTASSNPGWNILVQGSPAYKPRDFFGLPASLYDPTDARRNFFNIAPSVVDGVDVLRTMTGFYTSQTGTLPVYIPDEMKLIKAECIIRNPTLGTLAQAVTEINAVRTQTAGDPFGVNAALATYSGVVDVPSLLVEVYRQRCAELYLQGVKMEDCRRFGRPSANPAPAATDERTRNFYPYPLVERNLNPNTPADPAI
jgi:starch-binding outer membrane protein, SusD/RagB family